MTWPGAPKSASSPPLNAPSTRFPFNITGKVDPEVEDAIRSTFNGLTVHEQAFAALPAQLKSAAKAAVTNNITQIVNNESVTGGGVTSFNSSTGAVIFVPSLGTVNDQLGNTSYRTQQQDAGAKIIVGDSSLVTVTLNQSVLQPWFTVIDNDSSAVAVLMPDSTGSAIYGAQSIPPGGFGIVHFDGTNFWADATTVEPQNYPPVAHEWLESYNSSTGSFTATQPAFSDVSGNISEGQLPTAGLTVIITTAALTPTGTQGSMTFQNGILVGNVPAT